MRRFWLLPFAVVGMLTVAQYERANAFPANPHAINATAAVGSDIQLARGGRRKRGGWLYRGWRQSCTRSARR